MSRIGASVQSVLVREIANSRVQMDDLSRQLSSGKVADTYGGLGSDRTMSLALREEKTRIAGYQDSITLATTRVKVMDTVIEHMRENGSDMRSQLLVAGFEPSESGQTLAQMQAETRFADAVTMLNTDVAGRHLFAGAKTGDAPVAPASDILNGRGTKAGFRQVMDERRQADVGTGGLGRLVLTSATPTTVSLAEDVAGSPFGFKLDSVRTESAGVTTTGPAGAPAGIDLEFSLPLPADGEKIVVTLALPDGTQTELTLAANTQGVPKEGEFSVGADAATTRQNFQTALSSLIANEADTTLIAASMQAAANDYFVGGTDSPVRVDGPPFDSATSLRAATPEDTVSWYTGDKSSTPARETSIARIGENTLVAYGARADEEGFANMMKQFAILSSASFDADNPADSERYAAMSERVASNLGNSDPARSIDGIVGELASAQGRLSEADERYIASDNMITGFLSDIETADINEVATKLLSMQTQLQASYQVTSMLSKLSLANFL